MSLFISLIIIITALLMPKVIQPRRHDKTISANQFWAIRDQQKQQVSHPTVYRSLEVASRHRFTKPSEQASNFRPLAYFYHHRPLSDPQGLFQQQTDSHLGQYLKSVQGRVSAPLALLKRWCAGHKSIVHNKEKIYDLLWQFLNLEDSWELLQALTKDCRGTGISSWLSKGLASIGEEVEKQAGNSFSLSLFGRVFESVCVLMEYHFDEIAGHLNEFFLVFASAFLKHSNKYLRKFSLEAFSYIMNNLSDSTYSDFLKFLLELHSQSFFSLLLPLPALLVQRLSIVRGCLSTPSLGFLLSQLHSFREAGVAGELTAEYLFLMVSQLNPKGAVEGETVLFDLNSVVQAILKATSEHPDYFNPVLITAFAQFINLAESDPRRFEPRTPRETQSLATTWQLFSSFFQSNASHFGKGDHLHLALAVLSSKGQNSLFSRGVMEFYRGEPVAVETLVDYLHGHLSAPSKSLLQVLVLICRQALSEFFLEGKHQEVIYKLLLCLKRNRLPLLEVASLSLGHQQIVNTLDKQKEQLQQLIPTLRALTLLKLDSLQPLAQYLVHLRNQTLKQYENYLEGLLSKKGKLLDQGSPHEQFYDWTEFARQIIVYSHHEIAWVKQVFNLHEAFSLLFQHLHLTSPHSAVWNQLLVNRPSAISDQAQHAPEETLTFIGSRNRGVRLKALTLIRSILKGDEEEEEVLQLLVEIDREDVTLDNEREVKRNLGKLQQLAAIFQGHLTEERSFLFSHLLQWCLGFAFTGFKLIETPFVALFSQLISHAPHLVAPRLIPFLQYYNYKHSRQYEADIAPRNPKPHLANQFSCGPSPLDSLLAEDLEIVDVETVEWIGLERVAAAVKSSAQGKTNLHEYLSGLVQAYFGVQFSRQKRQIRSRGAEVGSPLLLPPKSRFLGVVLNLSPEDFMPPVECLHFLRKEYFEVGRVREAKRHPWELLWEKESQKNKKDKTEKVRTTVRLEQLSPIEEDIYLHYLWKELLEGNHHHKRIVLEHLRNELPHLTPRLLPLLLDSLHLRPSDSLPQTAEYLGRNNKKTVLNHMFILKSMIQHLRNELGSESELEKVCWLVLALIRVCHPEEAENRQKMMEVEDRQGEVMGGDEAPHQQGEDEPQPQDHEEEQPEQQGEVQAAEQEKQQQQQRDEGEKKLPLFLLYKQHRKELQKLLQTLFSTQHLTAEATQSILTSLLSNSRINLPKACRLSVPGLLHVMLRLSQSKQHCLTLVRTQEGRIVSMLAETIWVDQTVGKPLAACFNCWLQIIANILLPEGGEMGNQSEDQYQLEINQAVIPQTPRLLDCILTYLEASTLKNDKQHQQMMEVVAALMKMTPNAPSAKWSDYLLSQLSALAKTKHKMNELQFQRLSLLLTILTSFFRHNNSGVNPGFLRKVITLLPHLKDLEQRQQLLTLLTSTHLPLGLSPNSVRLTQKLSEVSRNGLISSLNFTSFFEANSQYNDGFGSLTQQQHEFFLHVLMSHALNEELPVRRAVNQTLKTFLKNCANELNSAQGKSWGQIVERITRTLLELINKPQEEAIFWSLVDHLEACFSWIANNSVALGRLLTPSALSYSTLFQPNRDFLQGLVSLSEANKLKALKQLRDIFEEIKLNQNHCRCLRNWGEGGSELPHPVVSLIVPILSYLIIRPHETKSNLASTLSVVSLDLLPLISNLLPFSLLKKELKRLLSRLRFSDTDSKDNIAVVKMIGQLLQGLPGETAAAQLSSFVEQHGFEEFHQKLALHRDTQVEEEPEEEEQGGKEKIPDFFDRLEEFEEDEAVHRNFLSFEKKMMELEEDYQEEGEVAGFLRKQVLPPLRALLSGGEKGKEGEESSKARVLLSVTTVQVLLRLPLDTFLREFQKVVSSLARLLKKKAVEVREYARGCLCAIGKATGHQLLYSIVNSLQFHLKDNFDRHVLNYTLYKMLEGMGLAPGQLDYCLPLILPAAVDELWGRTGEEKDMVARREAPTLKMEARKRKGLDLFQLIFSVIGKHQLNYSIDFLEKYLCQHLTSEDSLGKYDQMLGALGKGLANNSEITDPSNAALLLEAVAIPLSALRSHLRWLSSEASGRETQQVQEWRRRKADKDSTLSLQEETGRNRSIFARLNLEVAQRKNKETVTAALIQFHLTVLSLLIRKQVVSPSTAPTHGAQLLTIAGFLVDCLDHRDNRLVSKSLKVLHLSLHWKLHLLAPEQSSKMQALRRQASRKILGLAETLTMADEELLKESFIFLNDLVSEAAINLDTLPSFVGLVKVHLSTSDDQPQLPEVFRLLKTLLVKGPLYLYHPLLDDLHNLLQVQLATTADRDIRELARSCLSLYLRDRNTLQPSIDFINQLSQKQGRTPVDYSNKIKEELSFYLNNLESRGQEGVLQLLHDWIQQREKQEIEQYFELIVLSVMTARTNQLAAEAAIDNQQLKSSHPADPLLQLLLQTVDNQKLKSLGEKSLVWGQSAKNTPIRLCGITLLRMMVPHLPSLMNQDSICSLAKILTEELQSFGERESLQKRQAKMDPQWESIMGRMEEEGQRESCDLSCIECLRIMLHVSQQAKHLMTHQTIFAVWSLLLHSHKQVQELALSISLCFPLLATLDQQQNNSKSTPRKIVNKLIFSGMEIEKVEALVCSLFAEELTRGEDKVRAEISQLLLSLALKAHIKPKAFERSLPRVITLINHVVLAEQLAGQRPRQMFLKDSRGRSKLLEMTLKLSSNGLIGSEAQALCAQTSQLIKNEMGAGDYFKEVSQFEEEKRARRQQETTRKAELALLDPEALGQERKKKRKLQ